MGRSFRRLLLFGCLLGLIGLGLAEYRTGLFARFALADPTGLVLQVPVVGNRLDSPTDPTLASSKKHPLAAPKLFRTDSDFPLTLKLLDIEVQEPITQPDGYLLVTKWTLEATNNSAKNVRAITGSIYVKDLFERVVQRAELTYQEEIPAKQSVKWQQPLYLLYYSRVKDLSDLDLKNDILELVEEQVLYSDGTKLVIPCKYAARC